MLCTFVISFFNFQKFTKEFNFEIIIIDIPLYVPLIEKLDINRV